jgi:hypothetical protein
MPISSLHTELKKRSEDILRNRRAIEGETEVKKWGPRYLPVPPGMADAQNGSVIVLEHGKRENRDSRYDFYKKIAEFPEELGEQLQGFQGIIHGKPPKMQLPRQLKYLEEVATPDGRALDKLWTLMTEEVLVGGRIALLCDIVDDQIVFAPYSVENVLNWKLSSRRDGERPEWVVLRETACIDNPDDEFETVEVTRYLELRMMFNQEAADKQPDTGGLVYHRKTYIQRDGEDAKEETPFTPIRFFGKFFGEIPLTVVNALDISYDFGSIPMSPLVKIAFLIYRRSADYNRSIYIKTDPQPWISGVTDESEIPNRIGGEEVWAFSNPQAKAGYLDIEGDGIPHQRTAIQDDWTRFHLQSAKLLQASETPSESGEAVRRKQAAKQVTLKAVTLNVAEGLERSIRKAAELLGVAPTSVMFKPDTDFSVPKMSGDEAGKWSQAKATGFPISDRSLHEMARLGGATEMTFEDEMRAMEDDAERVPPPAPPAPDQGDDDVEEQTQGEEDQGDDDVEEQTQGEEDPGAEDDAGGGD